MITFAEFLVDLETTTKFNFDWTHGPYGGRYVVGDSAGDLARLDDDNARQAAREYIAAVRAAQEIAAEAMEDARGCYREADLDGTLAALREAAAAERAFGDDPTYRSIVDYLAAVVAAEADRKQRTATLPRSSPSSPRPC